MRPTRGARCSTLFPPEKAATRAHAAEKRNERTIASVPIRLSVSIESSRRRAADSLFLRYLLVLSFSRRQFPRAVDGAVTKSISVAGTNIYKYLHK